MSVRVATIDDVRQAVDVMSQHLSPPPLIRSYALEHALGFDESRRVWLKDYGWTPVGSFKLFGALNWTAQNLERIGD
ncbi:MAG: threonine/serine dehydratase, partial [Candidatus Latescibacteria bacterium]|nr:threonine/serine dehydratase [Candidatus Latescibacterota bacterium]